MGVTELGRSRKLIQQASTENLGKSWQILRYNQLASVRWLLSGDREASNGTLRSYNDRLPADLMHKIIGGNVAESYGLIN